MFNCKFSSARLQTHRAHSNDIVYKIVVLLQIISDLRSVGIRSHHYFLPQAWVLVGQIWLACERMTRRFSQDSSEHVVFPKPYWYGVGASTISGQSHVAEAALTSCQGMCAVCATPCSCTVWCRRGLKRRPVKPCHPRGLQRGCPKFSSKLSSSPLRLPQNHQNMGISLDFIDFIGPILGPPHVGLLERQLRP